tara:strand:+ start:181 stop:1620 length:1440 start_codon:yes stop_codon:yes gene_type:complete
MAYKFQLGSFTASGSIKAESGFDTGTSNVTVGGSGSVFFNGFESSITATNPDVLDVDAGLTLNLKSEGTNRAVVNSTGVTVTGQISGSGNLLGGGNLTVKGNTTLDGSLKVNGTSQAAVAVANDHILFVDADDGTIKKETIGAFATDLAGAGLEQNGNIIRIAAAAAGAGLTGGAGSALAVQVSGAISLADDKLGLSGSVAGNGLTFQNALQNGQGDHSHIEKLAVQLETTNALSVSSNGIDLKGTIAGDRTFSGDVKVGGDLMVTGTTITVNSTSILVTGSIVFEGSTADGAETTLAVIDPSADRTISLPDLSANATLAAFSDASFSNANITPSPITLSELNILDGGTAASATTLVDADRFICNDNGTMKQVALSDLKTYIGNNSNLDVSLKENGNALAVGVNYFANLAAASSGSLPASPSVGDAVYVKAPANCSSTNTLQIAAVGSHQIDGADQIVLESPHAAVMCVYVVANVWKVF